MTTFFRLPPRLRHAFLTSFLSVARQNPHSLRRFSTTSPIMTSAAGRSYADAIALLDSLQSNRAIVSSISDTARDKNLDAIPEMLDWTKKAGYDVSDFAKRGLKCIHVAGTKGKGSVCVMVENILLQYRKRDAGGLGKIGEDKGLGKIGLYTSPHLITVRERIRLDGVPISESMFTRYFFELWDRFSSATTSNLSDPNPFSLDVRPGYFRYLTLLALHTFMEEGVETAIVECGIGGEYDSTNILPPEAVTVSAITKLGIDHVGMLGNAIKNIAWHKGGIMKEGVPAYTVEQVPDAQAVLENCAVVKGSNLAVVVRLPLLKSKDVKLGLGGDFQKDNASLAIAVATSHLQSMGITEGVPSFKEVLAVQEISSQFWKGLETASWPGRWEVRKEGNINWLIDGAHTIDSIEATAHWYVEKLEDALNEELTPTATMLIFNQQDRDAKTLMRRFLTVLSIKSPAMEPGTSRLQRMRFSAYHKMFTYAAFCTNIPFKDQVPKDLDLRPQQEIAKVYGGLSSNSLHMCFGSVEEAVELARRVSQGDEKVLVLVTGSLHLVGGLLKVLDRDPLAPIESTNPQKSSRAGPLPEIEHALDEEEPIPFPLQGKTLQVAEPTTRKSFERTPQEISKAREDVIKAFLSERSYQSQASSANLKLIEPLAPASDRAAQYFYARSQPFQKLHSANPTTRRALDEGKLQAQTRKAKKQIIKDFFSDTTIPMRRDPVESPVATTNVETGLVFNREMDSRVKCLDLYSILQNGDGTGLVVDKVVNSRVSQYRLQFQVLWKPRLRWMEKYWFEASEIANSEEKIEEFHAQNPHKHNLQTLMEFRERTLKILQQKRQEHRERLAEPNSVVNKVANSTPLRGKQRKKRSRLDEVDSVIDKVTTRMADQVADSRLRWGHLQYRVVWNPPHCGQVEDRWYKPSELEDAQKQISEFHSRNPHKDNSQSSEIWLKNYSKKRRELEVLLKEKKRKVASLSMNRRWQRP